MPARVVSRPRLLQQLDETAGASVVLLAAPAGYGKSTLLSQWALQQKRPLRWLTVGPREDEAENLLGRVTDALEQLAGATGANDRRPGDDGGRRRRRPIALGVLASKLGELPDGAVLILDGVDNLRSPGSVRVLAELTDLTGASLQLALASRTEPTFGCGRLRASGRLLQLGPSDLEMTVYEARQALAAVGLELDEAGLARLVDHTEGWPAGLYLAALSLRALHDPGADPVAALRGDERIAEYVEEELLAPLPEASRGLLGRTSVLESLSAGLCDAVLQSSGSGPILHELAVTHLMLRLQHPGHGWYRCHSLVREVMRAELELTEPDEVAALHRRASSWFGDAGDIDAAVDHAVAAHDHLRTGALLWALGSKHASPTDDRPGHWLDAFNDQQIAASAELALAAAYRCLAEGNLPQAEQLAMVAATAVDHQSRSERAPAVLASITLLLAAGAGDGIEQMQRDTTDAYRLLHDASRLRPLACVLRGVALELLGARPEARSLLEEALRRMAGGSAQLEALCLAELALQDVSEGDWGKAGDQVARAAAVLTANQLEHHPTSALTFAASALVLSHRGIADEAKQELVTATRLLEELGNYAPWHEVQARIVMARACVRLSDVVRARALLSEASRWARRMDPVESLIAALDAGWGEVDALSASALRGPASLTMAELRVLRFLPTHLSFREIGERLHVSGNTVKTQAHAVYAKLGAASRSEAVARAVEVGLIEATIV
ncbi:MAG TPA: LuxR C-terminal-related transcriptional regulator [Solirubrobacteraceae bacterium]|nr:LuxR C-terminal-related transcriptional regulator [Solirubrobacteraceae bacterium]